MPSLYMFDADSTLPEDIHPYRETIGIAESQFAILKTSGKYLIDVGALCSFWQYSQAGKAVACTGRIVRNPHGKQDR